MKSTAQRPPEDPTSIARKPRRAAPAVLLAAALAGLGGCAVGPNPRDPFEPFNRNMTQLNEGIDTIALMPAATVYRQVLPPIVRTGVSNFFGNLSDPWSFVNSALQFHPQDAAENFMRFNVNTFFGLGGILDIASELQIERHREDFGQTLGRWGVPAGPYLVLPLLGPSTMRDTLALPVDWQVDPVHYLNRAGTRDSLYVTRAVNVRSDLLLAGSVLDEAALDKYSFTRDAYLQRRRAQVFDVDKSTSDKGLANKEPDTDGKEPDVDGRVLPLPENTPASASASPTAPAVAFPGALAD
ncbi:MAG: lipoprotein precursor-like protein [Ramlibacter sp.]|jgi:phospholipid-binding lipoprotein MlaA|nr:lipoprotein precursor-like protein [Ramlibacter sp.]